MTDDKTRQLENRIETLESTIEKMMPSRRDALKMGGAALAGGSLMAGTASAGTNQVGTIGSQASPVDLESEDINNADTVTTENLVVNNTATGPFGGGVLLESGDSLTIETIDLSSINSSFITLYSGPARDVLGGILTAGNGNGDFLYEFSDNTTVHKNGSGTTYTTGNISRGRTAAQGLLEVDFLPPAKDVIKIEVGSNTGQGAELGAEVILKD